MRTNTAVLATADKNSTRVLWLVSGVLLILSAILWRHLPEQDAPTYFHFADEREFAGIQNYMNVLSNLAFLWIGILGLRYIWQSRSRPPTDLQILGLFLALATVLVTFGSAYFHWSPSFETIFWDRMPMTLGFTSITSLVIADRVNGKVGLRFFLGFALIGFFSVLGYREGWISLRPYGLVQFGSMIFMGLVISFLRSSRFLSNKTLSMTLGLYVLAKIAEFIDQQVFSWTGFISGHTIKHLLAAAAIYQTLVLFRGPLSTASTAKSS